MHIVRLGTLSKTAPSLLAARCFSTTSEYKVKGTAEFFNKQKVLGRPVSPHLTIYKPQLTSMLSISHRASGVGYAVVLYGATLLTVLPNSFSHYVQLAEQYAPGAGLMFAVKSVVILPLVYHTVNGFRHLAWDMGKGFQITDVYKTGTITVAISILLSLAIVLAL